MLRESSREGERVDATVPTNSPATALAYPPLHVTTSSMMLQRWKISSVRYRQGSEQRGANDTDGGRRPGVILRLGAHGGHTGL